MLIALSIIITLLIAAVIGVATFLIMGTWVAALIAGVASLIAVSVCVAVVKIIKYLKNK